MRLCGMVSEATASKPKPRLVRVTGCVTLQHSATNHVAVKRQGLQEQGL